MTAPGELDAHSNEDADEDADEDQVVCRRYLLDLGIVPSRAEPVTT